MEKKSSEYVNLSRFMSKILRHQPQIIGIELERNGAWADVNAFIDGINKFSKHKIDRQLLERIVADDAKGRYSFNADGTKLRANQGHSIDVVIDMEKRTPPKFLYHGTAAHSMESIMRQGLLPQKRNFVHLSPDYDTAVTVGYRHSKPEKPVILRVNAEQMAADGYEFMISENGVWQINCVPPRYFEVIDSEVVYHDKISR